MNIYRLTRVALAVESISKQTDTELNEVLDGLVGWCISEEVKVRILSFLEEGK